MKVKKNYLNRDFKKIRSKDLLTKPQRSSLMSKIRSKGTKLETEFIKTLRKTTRRKFQTNVATIKGKPDIVFTKAKLCVFIDSDFWHGWYYPKWKHLLKDDFWRNKIEKNRMRDKKYTAYLRKEGWTVLRFWEHQIKKDQKKIMSQIINILK